MYTWAVAEFHADTPDFEFIRVEFDEIGGFENLGKVENFKNSYLHVNAYVTGEDKCLEVGFEIEVVVNRFGYVG